MQLTTYGIVMARYQANSKEYLEDTPKLSMLNDGNKVLQISQAANDNTSPEFKEQDELQETD